MVNGRTGQRTAFPVGAGRAFDGSERNRDNRCGGIPRVIFLKASRYALPAALCVLLLSGCGSAAPKEANDFAAGLLAEGKYAEAASAYRSNINEGYFVAEAYRGLGLAQMAEGEVADACISLERSLLAVEKEPVAFVRDVRLYLAWCRNLHGERDKAIAIYSDMLLGEPDPDILFLRGRLYMEAGQEEDAARDFERAVEVTKDVRTFLGIYRVYADYGKNADGNAYLERALAFAGSESANVLERARVQFYMKNYSEARRELQSALAEDPDNTEALFLLGRVYLALGDTPNARSTYREILKNPATAVRAYAGLLACDLMEKNTDEAQKELAEAMELPGASKNRDLRYYEILVYEYRYDWENARRKSAAFVADFPTDAEGLRENSFLASR